MVLSQIFIFVLFKVVSLKVPVGKTIYSTYSESILTSTERTEMSLLAPCTHETSDTRLNAADAASSRHRRIRIRCNITDIVVLAILVASTLPTDELWITYGSVKNVRNIPALAIAMSLGPDRASTLPMCHALTEFDTVSFFEGRGKKTAKGVKKVFPQMTPVLKVLKVSPQEIIGGCMVVLERFVVLIYDRTSSLTKVNEARQKLFLKRSRSLDSIPPTRALLEQHVKRGCIRGQTLLCQPVLPSPSDWGWQQLNNS